MGRRETEGTDAIVSGIGRVAALGAVIAAVALVAIVLFGGGGGGYEVTAKFVNAGQIVKGNPVQTGGTPIGTVKDIKITDDGQAAIRFSIKEDYTPLREGTRASIRQFSQSGIANRYVDLQMPPNGSAEIPDGGSDRVGQHEDRGRPRPALQHARPADPPRAAGLLQEPGAPVPRRGNGRQRHLPVPQPRPVHIERPLPRAEQG